jgi:hypothetical protein
MRKKSLLILAMVLACAGLGFAQSKKITNAELEKHRQERLKNEENYRQNYAKQGFPSPAELEKQEAERQLALAEYAQKAKLTKRAKENNLLARAEILRFEISRLDAEISYLRKALNKTANRQTLYGFVQTFPNYSADNFRQKSFNFSFGNHRGSASFSSNSTYYNNYNYNTPIFFSANNQSTERQEIISRLRYLEQQRAGWLAQWNLLADEAHTAGVRID